MQTGTLKICQQFLQCLRPCYLKDQRNCLLKYCKIPFHSSQLFMNESFGTNQFFSPIEMDWYRVFPNTKLNLNDLPQQIRLCTLNVCLKFSSANLTFAHEESHRAVRHF